MSTPPQPGLKIDDRAYRQALACVHCGLCLPACPTYTQTFHEADSPRGRIQLMRGLADGNVQPSGQVLKHLDLCLDCRACETACPSGVVYHELIEGTRHSLAKTSGHQSKFLSFLFRHVFAHRRRLKFALLPARLLQKVGLWKLTMKLSRVLPGPIQKMQQMLPTDGPLWPGELPEESGQLRQSGKRIALLAGCVGSVMYESANRAAIFILTKSGATVHVPRAQVCCGAIHYHNEDHGGAKNLARKNIDALWPWDQPAPEYITTTIAGCGAMLREYGQLLADDPVYADRAKAFASRVRDISQVLLELDLPAARPMMKTVTYHDACHLLHAQKVADPPRQLLSRIPGLTIIPLPESDICCGAAGTYNISQPEMATDLGQRKLNNILATGARICVTGNVGCAMQIQSIARERHEALEVKHPVELFAEAIK